MAVVIPDDQFRALVEAGVFTSRPDRKEKCCGLPRDEAGMCQYRPHHPIYVEPLAYVPVAYVGHGRVYNTPKDAQ